MTTFLPLYDRVVVRRIDTEKTYKGIIHLPETSQQKPQMGLVVSAGCGKFDDSFPSGYRKLLVKEGDKVLFAKYSGTEIRLNEEELTIMREEDVLGLVMEED